MAGEILGALPGALARGALTAVLVGLLLVAALRWGRGAAGLLAGLPTVTGPALLWLALDLGPAFAAQAAPGAVAAAIPCALFAVGYGFASRRHGPARALLVALLAGALPLPALAGVHWPLAAWLAFATVVAVACQGALGVLAHADAASGTAAGSGPGPAPRQGWLTTAAVSGLVSALAAALAGAVGPFWAGVLTSPPLLAAAVAVVLHARPRGAAEALRFLHGYTAGLLGRGLFVAAFGALVVVTGTLPAFGAALAIALVAGAVSARRVAPHTRTISWGREERA
jgi:hypothetical protein